MGYEQMPKRLTNAETIFLLDKGLQIPPSVAESAYRRLYELENKMDAEKAKTTKAKKETK